MGYSATDVLISWTVVIGLVVSYIMYGWTRTKVSKNLDVSGVGKPDESKKLPRRTPLSVNATPTTKSKTAAPTTKSKRLAPVNKVVADKKALYRPGLPSSVADMLISDDDDVVVDGTNPAVNSFGDTHNHSKTRGLSAQPRTSKTKKRQSNNKQTSQPPQGNNSYISQLSEVNIQSVSDASLDDEIDSGWRQVVSKPRRQRQPSPSPES